MLAEAFLLGSIAAISAGLAAASRRFSTRRVFDRHKQVAIGDVADGSVVRIAGVVRPGGGDLLRAPMSGRTCIAWTLTVREDRGQRDANFVGVLDERILRPFFLDDEHDTAFVTPLKSSLSLTEDQVLVLPVGKATPSLEAHLAERDILIKPGRRYIMAEAVLCVGQTITVVGRGSWESDPSRPGEGYRSVGRRLVVTADAKHPVHVSDDPTLVKNVAKS